MGEKVKKQETKVLFNFNPPNILTAKVRLVGTADLIVNRFSEKSKRHLFETHTKVVKTTKPVRNPAQEFEDAKYIMKNGKDGFPALCIKNAIVDSYKFFKESKIEKGILAGTLFVRPDDTSTGLIEIKYKKCEIGNDIVRVGTISKQPDIRYRPYYKNWYMDVEIDFDGDFFTKEQIGFLLTRAGISMGLGEWRIQRGGEHGSFEIQNIKK